MSSHFDIKVTFSAFSLTLFTLEKWREIQTARFISHQKLCSAFLLTLFTLEKLREIQILIYVKNLDF